MPTKRILHFWNAHTILAGFLLIFTYYMWFYSFHAWFSVTCISWNRNGHWVQNYFKIPCLSFMFGLLGNTCTHFLISAI
uniref:Uncharacterized protein n=1 Tax=Rhizophora mucronata TaxID=61149 RepID=A0A2P2JBR1_RHIMU